MKSNNNMYIRKLNLHGLSLVMVALSATMIQAQTTAYVGATIETAGKTGRLENATMVVQDGKIIDVGTDVDVPDDARVISMKGKTITPGVVDPYFVFAASSGGAPATRTVTFRGRTITVPVRPAVTSAGGFQKVGEYFYPFSYNFMPTVRSGITSANLVTSGRGLSAFANISDDRTPEMLFEKEGVLFATVTNQTTSLDLIRKPLEGEKKSTAKTTKTTTAQTTASKPSASKSATDIKKYWADIIEGKKRLFVNMNSSAAVAYVLQVAQKHEKAKFVLVATGPNLYPLLDQLKSLKNIAVVLQPGIDTVPYTRDLMNVSRLLAEHKIPFALSMSLSRSQLNASQDDPFFPVATLVRTGLDRDVALESLTIKPARMMGIDKTHGSIAKDKHANFLIFDGDPMTTGSRLEQVYLNGNKIHEN